MTTLEKLTDIITDHLGVEPQDINAESHIVNDLGVDSLDEIELIMAIEEAFDIEISDEQAQECLTVGKMVALIESLAP